MKHQWIPVVLSTLLFTTACNSVPASPSSTVVPSNNTTITEPAISEKKASESTQGDASTKKETKPAAPVSASPSASPVSSPTSSPTSSPSTSPATSTAASSAVNTVSYYVDKVYRIKPVDEGQDRKVVLLTFDDTPYGETTYQLLDILDEYDAKALFFINGHLAESRKEVLKDIVARGHILGNHTWWHDSLRKMDAKKAKEEIESVSDLIEEITGERPVYFRPPFGQNSDASLSIVKKEGMQTMNWSVGSEDWVYSKPGDADQVVASVMRQMHDGANILFHDKEVTVKALKPILEKLSKDGYRFITPTEVRVSQ
jgi:peptidoglycan/xylan/chitin deacetylase (PgdA/CDA1 family)